MENIIVLLDSKADPNNFLVKGLRDRKTLGSKISVFGITRPKSMIVRYFKFFILAFRVVLFSSKKNDIVIAWQDTIGVFVSFFSLVFSKKIKILSLNIMYKDKSEGRKDITKDILTWFYKQAFKNDNFYFTLNSSQLINKYNMIFKIKQKSVFILLDTYEAFIKDIKLDQKKERFIFCGGRNGRDWNVMFEIANRVPDISFIFIMDKVEQKNSYQLSNKNVTILQEVSKEEYYKILAKSIISCFPLSTTAPAGIMAIQTASLCESLILSTKTPSTETYIKYGYLFDKGNVDDYVRTIEDYWSEDLNQSDIRERVKLQKEYIAGVSSAESYIDKIVSIVDEIRD